MPSTKVKKIQFQIKKLPSNYSNNPKIQFYEEKSIGNRIDVLIFLEML